MRQKFAIAAGTILILAGILTGCGKNVSIKYGEIYKIQDTKLEGKNNLIWENSDTDIIEVSEGGVVTAKAPGKAKVEIKENNTLIASYTFNVSIVPIKEIVFATDKMEITDEEDSRVKYTLLPQDASDYGITWTSADESVATVNEKGEIDAKEIGKTTIIATTENGVSARCSVEVTQVNAWERLDEDEKKFVEAVLPRVREFKNPESVKFVEVWSNPIKDTDIWYFTVSATNGYGADLIKSYGLFGGAFGGILTESPKASGKVEYRADLITQAVHQKLGY